MSQHVYVPRRRRLATLVSVATAATLLAGLTPSAVSAETVPVEKVPLRIGTYNIQASQSTAGFAQAVGMVLGRVDILSLQEVNSREKEAVLADLASSGWSYYRPKPGQQNPVVWDKARFAFLSGRLVTLVGQRWVGDEHPLFDSVIGPRYATVVRLRDRATGQNVSIVNTHLVPGAVRGGKRWEGRPLTFRHYARSLKRLVRVARNEADWGRAYVMGDYNAGWVQDERNRLPRLPYMRFREQRMKSMWATDRPLARGTRQTSLIDQIFSRSRAASTSVEYDVEFSDHYPAIATYLVPVA